MLRAFIAQRQLARMMVAPQRPPIGAQVLINRNLPSASYGCFPGSICSVLFSVVTKVR